MPFGAPLWRAAGPSQGRGELRDGPHSRTAAPEPDPTRTDRAQGRQPLPGTRPRPAEPYAVMRDHVGVVPVTRHSARYSGIGGV